MSTSFYYLVFAKKALFGIVTGLMLSCSSCSDDFVNMDTDELNAWLADKGVVESPRELIRLYYGEIPDEGYPSLTVESKDLGSGRTEVSLIHDGLLDDSQKAIQLVLVVAKIDSTWYALEFKKNCKCHEGRGHTEWGTEYCN